MNNLFSKEKVNSGRQVDLDIAKGIAIVFMVLVHVNEVYQSADFEGGIYNNIVEFLGSPPAAPVFMFLLGLGIVYSKRSTAAHLFKRGIIIFILGFVLNFFRDFIPYYLLAIINSDMSYKNEAYACLFGIDILPFAGLTFMFFAFIKKFKVKPNKLVIFYLIFATINLFVRGKSTGSYVGDVILGLIWGTYDYSWFPFLTWIAYPIFGYIFGEILIVCNDKDLFYKKCLIYSGVFLIPLLTYAYINQVHFGAFGELYQETYYHHDLMGNIILLDFVVFWISIIHFISKHISESVCKVFARWSKNINKIYCTHWIILGYLMLVIEEESLSPIKVILLSLVIFILADFISDKFLKIKAKPNSIKKRGVA